MQKATKEIKMFQVGSGTKINELIMKSMNYHFDFGAGTRTALQLFSALYNC
jgi:hypothetical protein